MWSQIQYLHLVKNNELKENIEFSMTIHALIIKEESVIILILTKRVEDQESLKSSAVVSQLPTSVQNKINNLLSNGVVSTSIIVGSIFFACD